MDYHKAMDGALTDPPSSKLLPRVLPVHRIRFWDLLAQTIKPKKKKKEEEKNLFKQLLTFAILHPSIRQCIIIHHLLLLPDPSISFLASTILLLQSTPPLCLSWWW